MKNTTLKDGQKVLLRPIKPEDENMWLEMFKTFSEETVRFRFFRIIKDTPHEVRTRYCNIDYDREMGIVAEIEKDGKKQLLGVSRLIQDPARPDEAEFAIVVSDECQRQGLGSEFLDFLIESAEMKQKGQTNRLENIAVRRVDITEASQEHGTDYITVLFTANLLDYTVDDKTGQVVAGDRNAPVKFEEFWTFCRLSGQSQWALAGTNQK